MTEDPTEQAAAEKAALDARKIALAQAFVEALPHARALNMQVEEITPGRAAFSMPWAEELVGDPETGVLHGGAVSALLDTTAGAAVISHPANAGQTATLDLRIDYMRAATPGQAILARAHCYHVTRSVAFVRAVALDDDRDNPVAAATGAFTFQMHPDAAPGEETAG